MSQATSQPLTSRRTSRATIRWLIRCIILLASILLLLPGDTFSSWAAIVPASSPLVAIASTLSARTFHGLALLGLAVAAITLVRRRWFCRWICPTGLLADLATRAGRRCGRRGPGIPLLGQWFVAIMLGGALLGYPALLWLDPLALFSSSFGVLTGMSGAVIWLSLAGLLTILILSMVWPGIWCHKVCPLGATQDLLARATRSTQRLVARDDRPAPALVNAGMSRRIAIGSMIGLGWAAAARTVMGRQPQPLRPPGAAPPSLFAGLCVRCGNCTRACPANIIRPELLDSGIATLLAPVVDFDSDYCREDCVRCTEVCPSGALRPVVVEEKRQTRMGLARVDMTICLLAEDRECAACRNHCPFEAIRYVWSDIDYMLSPHIDPSRCPGCGACQVACPTQPSKAIVVVPA